MIHIQKHTLDNTQTMHSHYTQLKYNNILTKHTPKTLFRQKDILKITQRQY